MKIRVLLINGAELVRAGLRTMISEQSDMRVADEVDSMAVTRIKKAAKANPADVAVIAVPAYCTAKLADLVSAAQGGSSDCKVVLLSALCDPQAGVTVDQFGSDACLSLESPAKDILDVIRDMAAGGEATRKAASGIHLVYETDALTVREREILKMMADGFTTKEIAVMLEISPKTVETHRLNFMNKLRCHSVAELTKLAIREALSSLEPRDPAGFGPRSGRRR